MPHPVGLRPTLLHVGLFYGPPRRVKVDYFPGTVLMGPCPECGAEMEFGDEYPEERCCDECADSGRERLPPAESRLDRERAMAARFE